MSRGECIKPRATKRSERTLRGIVLVIALVALWPTVAWAGSIGVPLTDGTLTLHVAGGSATDSELVATGPGFFIAAASGPFFVPPGCSNCSPGSSFAARTSVFGAFVGEIGRAHV